MNPSQATAEDLDILRQSLAAIRPGSAHQAHNAPPEASIYTPIDHATALDPQRALVVGNRGVGKSFWSAVLTHDPTRDSVAPNYPRLPLKETRAVLGYHEAAAQSDGPAPSPSVLASLIGMGYQPEDIWRGVLLKAVLPATTLNLPTGLEELLKWRAANIEAAEAAMRAADNSYANQGLTFLLVFDALDRLGRDWAMINLLTQGVLRLALEMRGYKALKAKIFMRSDQWNDETLFRFADASKIRADVVKLTWQPEDLFGLMFKGLIQAPVTGEALARLGGWPSANQLPKGFLFDQSLQVDLFYRFAGEFMGTNSKRGRTYTWIVDHLADAFGDTSPRSFLTALQKAAELRPAPRETVIDHNGIRAGVQKASQVRLQQLQEDYGWISEVIGALAGLEVPCHPAMFKGRWMEKGTATIITEAALKNNELLPLELQTHVSNEDALLSALENIGVVEVRDESRINMPDIFRVEARIKRRGGVRPPKNKS